MIDGLGCAVKRYSNIKDYPLLVDLCHPFPLRFRAYSYNCTNPPGGRNIDEYSVQVILPGHNRKNRSSLDWTDGRIPILAGYASIDGSINNGVFVLWDATMHNDFAYSGSMQVSAETIISAMYETVAESMRSNSEIVLAARPQNLVAALKRRVTISEENIRQEVNGIAT